jgi:hypothetical protein
MSPRPQSDSEISIFFVSGFVFRFKMFGNVGSPTHSCAIIAIRSHLGSLYLSSAASVIDFRLRHLRIFSALDNLHFIKSSCDSFGKFIK